MSSVPTYCQRARPIIGLDPETKCQHVIIVRCKRWSCRFCALKNKQKIICSIIDGKPTKLLTLTVNPQKFADPAAAYAYARPRIRKLIHLARKKFGSFEAAIVCEATKTGWPHWHLTVRAPYIPQRWYSSTWNILTGAPIIDIRSITDPKNAGAYVAKYVTKHATEGKPPWLPRVISYTLHYRPKKPPSPSEHFAYEFSKKTPNEVIFSLFNRNFRLYTLGKSILAVPGTDPIPEKYLCYGLELAYVITRQDVLHFCAPPPTVEGPPGVD